MSETTALKRRIWLDTDRTYRLAADSQAVRIMAQAPPPRATTPLQPLTPLSELRVTARRRVESLEAIRPGELKRHRKS